MRVLGIDPGTVKMGWGLVDNEGGHVSFWTYGNFSAPRDTVSTLLAFLHRRLTGKVETFHPDVIAIEAGFVGRNQKTALVIGYARAICHLVAGQHGLPIREHTPTEVKRGVASLGKASKESVRLAVAAILGAQETDFTLDESDALAVAITHLNATAESNVMERMYA